MNRSVQPTPQHALLSRRSIASFAAGVAAVIVSGLVALRYFVEPAGFPGIGELVTSTLLLIMLVWAATLVTMGFGALAGLAGVVTGSFLQYLPHHFATPAPFALHPGWQSDLLVFWAATGIVIGVVLPRQQISLRQRRAAQMRMLRRFADEYDSCREVAIVVGADARVLYLNPAAELRTGWRHAAALGEPLATVLVLCDASRERVDPFALPELSLAPPASSAGERDFLLLQSRENDPYAVVLTRHPLLSEEGQLDATLLLLADGEARLQATQRAAFAGQVLAASSDAVIGLDAAGRIQDWNGGARRLLGYMSEEVLGEDVVMLVSADRRNALLQSIRAGLDSAEVGDRDLSVLTRAGRDIDVSLAVFPVYPAATLHGEDDARHPGEHTADKSSTACVTVLTMRDIHQRRIGERRVRHVGAQLVQRAQELQTIFNIAPVGMAIADTPDCRHVRPNLALARVLGVERSADIDLDKGEPYSLWIEGRPLQPHESPLRAAVAQRCAIAPVELEIRAAGQITTVMAHGSPVIDQDDVVVGAIAVFVDISAMKLVHAERQLLLAEAIAARRSAEEASRLKEEFLATVSHELRTPLNAMHGWLEIMQRKPDAQTQARGLDVIRRNVRAQTRVIEDILDVSAFVTGKSRVVVAAVDLADVARQGLESMRPTAEARSVQIGWTAAPDTIHTAPVQGDADRLQQVVWNLLSNAVKFTPAGGRVELNIRRVGAQFVLSVSDSGEGIDAAFLPYVFDRFRQADSSIERRHSGLGLGLAIVRHLAELHGGHASVHSAGLGQGATFEISLPARPAPVAHNDVAAAAVPVVASGMPGVLAGKDVLIVEDDVSAAEMLAHALDVDGATVRTAHSADAALRLLHARRPDAIVSDIGMPERDGYAFISDVRAGELDAGMPRIFALAVTAYTRTEDRERALQAGFDAWLVKPVAPSHVTELLALHLRHDARASGAPGAGSPGAGSPAAGSPAAL